jgi:large subunit ribosomal protein L15e
MGIYKYIRNVWKKPDKSYGSLLKERSIEWRKSGAIEAVENPTRLDRARSLGYKAKKGYIVVRVRLLRGGRQRPLIKKGRRSKHNRRKKIVGKSYQWIAEERANRKYRNCEIIGSYELTKDGKYFYYEIILGDRELLSKYPDTKHFEYMKGKVFRGLTSSAKKSRGLRGKGKGHEKNRPSLRAHRRRGKN